MKEYILSVKQYRALKMMPDDINKDVTSIRQQRVICLSNILVCVGCVGYVR